ncbi:17228_t:CDS:2 [Cetraspora pellucida]|uniref:17228_t:CDS:1 n=1 Tax=Cetraspora pellucida TaxID=1433469 RepID=A0ACA9K3G8_9GLOM|nr:17228_t:CDS:2 [Cetraspora pellucida]
MSDERMNRLSIWSCRWWALYVLLQFYHLAQEQSLLTRRRRDIRLDDDVEVVQKQKRQLKAEGDRIFQDTLINVGYLPLTLHWSLENSSFPEIGVGVFGTLASAFELSKAWKAT